jgi:hypothetical protein
MADPAALSNTTGRKVLIAQLKSMKGAKQQSNQRPADTQSSGSNSPAGEQGIQDAIFPGGLGGF